MDYQQQGQAMAGQYVDPYANDIARHLSVAGASSSEDVIASLRSMNLGDNFWMHSFKVRVAGLLDRGRPRLRWPQADAAFPRLPAWLSAVPPPSDRASPAGGALRKDFQSQVDFVSMCAYWRDSTTQGSSVPALQGGALPSCQSGE